MAPIPIKTIHNTTYPAISPTRPELSTRGKNALITSGGSGIGAAIAKSTKGSIDIVVAYAGYMPQTSSIADSDPDDWWLGFDISVRGNFNLPQRLRDPRLDRGDVHAVHGGLLGLPRIQARRLQAVLSTTPRRTPTRPSSSSTQASLPTLA